jgi:hypothetical protein
MDHPCGTVVSLITLQRHLIYSLAIPVRGAL